MRRDRGQDRVIEHNVLDKDPIEVFRDVTSILEKNCRYLESVELNPVTLSAYKKVIRYLKRRSGDEIRGILGIRKQRTRPKSHREDPRISDDEILRLPLEQINQFLASTDVSRKFLERLASVRFGVSTGALSTLHGRAALVDKLRTLVGHEGTHDAISRAIGSSGDTPVRTVSHGTGGGELVVDKQDVD